jgi:hypothetical protein
MEEEQPKMDIMPSKFKLMKMSKGYNWEISQYGMNLEECMAKIRKADAEAKSLWGLE